LEENKSILIENKSSLSDNTGTSSLEKKFDKNHFYSSIFIKEARKKATLDKNEIFSSKEKDFNKGFGYCYYHNKSKNFLNIQVNSNKQIKIKKKCR
jgi:hypothetical protein